MKGFLGATVAAVAWMLLMLALSHIVAHSPTPGLVVGVATVAGALFWARRL